MYILLQDLRYAARQLRNSPGFTLAAVLTLAVGIGANTAIFSNMDAVVLHPLAVPELDRVMTLAEEQANGNESTVALANYEDWRRSSHAFEDLAVRKRADMSLTGAGDAAHVQTAQVSANFFSVLRAQPLTGRIFEPSECQPGHDAVALLNYGFWQRNFGGGAVLGRTIELDQRVYTIVGVMPKTMQYPSRADIYLPLASTPHQLANRADHNYFVTGRLRAGISVREAEAEMRILAGQLASAYPATNQGWSVKVAPLLDGINGDLTPHYYRLIMSAALFVFLVVCANIANLQLARGIGRRPEIALRAALGASRWRVVRQLVTENLLLSTLGAAAGVGIAALLLHISLITMPARVARYMAGWSNTSLNGRALAFSLVLAAIAGLIAGLAPAAEIFRINPVEQLKSGARNSTGPRRSRLRTVFAVAQIALAVALVAGAALISKGLVAMLHTADMYAPSQALVFNVELPRYRYDTAQKRAAWFAASLARLRALPGVTHAEIADALPNSDNGDASDFEIENRPAVPGAWQSALRIPVSDGYFAVLHIPIVSGRGFNSGDTMGSTPVAIVSERFAASYFAGQNPIGQRIHIGSDSDPWLTIAGVARETSYSLWNDPIAPAVYLNAAQLPPGDTTFIVYTPGDPLALAAPVRKAMAALDPTLPLDQLETYRQYLNELLTGLIYASSGLTQDAVIALLLAALGVFAVMSNLVGERIREIGVRLAMGASRRDVLGMILRRAARLMAVGLGLGLVLAIVLAHLAANLLRGVQSSDPLVFAGVAAIIAAVAMAASWLPAYRAAHIDPIAALRNE
jgi:predicted permease